MHRLTLLLSTAAVASGLAVSVSLLTVSEASTEASEGGISQGSLYQEGGPHPHSGNAPEHSQTVESSMFGPLARIGAGVFKFEVPEDGRYSIQARWPAGEGGERTVRFGVGTGDGLQWTKVSPRDSGEQWVEVGTFEMKSGQRRALQSPSGAPLTNPAESVKIVRDEPVAPGLVSDEPVASEEGEFGTMSARAGSNRLAVRRARQHIGTRYRLSPPHPCRSFKVEDCSCHTKHVFKKWRNLPDHPAKQWKYGKRVWKKSNLRPGDLVFFKERGKNNPITHVGIYSGAGNLVHASSYYGKVVESKMKYIKGYHGAKRLRL